MKHKGRTMLLKLVALIAAGSFIYPVLTIAKVMLFKQHGWFILLLSAFFPLLSGFFAGALLVKEQSPFLERVINGKSLRFIFFMLGKKPSPETVSHAALYAAGLLFAGAAALVYKSEGAFRVLFEVVTVPLLYLTGLKAYSSEFHQFMGTGAAKLGGFLCTGALIASYSIEECKPYKTVFFISAGLFVALFMIISNQANLDYNLFVNRGLDKAGQQKNIRSYNTRIVLTVFLIILLLFNIKPIILFAYDILWTATKALLGFLWKVLMWLLPEGETAQRGESAPPPDFFGGFETVRPVWNFIMNVLQRFFFLYILYWILVFLVKKSGKIVSKLLARIRQMFVSKKKHTLETDDYHDEIEDLKVQAVTPGEKERKGKRKPNTDYRRIKDPVERVRGMYRYMLTLLVHKAVPVEKSDTTGEICDKALHFTEAGERVGDMTCIYDRVRYGGHIPDESELHKAESLCMGLKEGLK